MFTNKTRADISIREIQDWEKNYSKRRGLVSVDTSDPYTRLLVGFLKLSEEIGELAESILRRQYDNILPELADTLIFACKIGKITEDSFGQQPLAHVIRSKIAYAEKRHYDRSIRDLTKPKGGFRLSQKKGRKHV